MPSPLPPLLAASPFHVREAREVGLTRRRRDAPDLAAPHHGVRRVDEAVSVAAECEGLLPVLRPDHVFSHSTAANLWGLPLPRSLKELGTPLHVLSPSGAHPRRPGVIGHRAQLVGGAFVVGIPVVDPVTAWLQCASLLGLDDLIAMGDALAGRWSVWPEAREVPLAALEVAVGRWGRRRGARRLQQALPWLRDCVWSPRETALRLVIIRAGLPEPPERNAEITDADGVVIGRGDLVYRRHKVVIEYEGDGHRTDRRQWQRDVAKYEAYADAGWRVVRVTDADMVAPAGLIARLTRLLTGEALP